MQISTQVNTVSRGETYGCQVFLANVLELGDVALNVPHLIIQRCDGVFSNRREVTKPIIQILDILHDQRRSGHSPQCFASSQGHC